MGKIKMDMSDHFEDPLLEILARLTTIEEQQRYIIEFIKALEAALQSPMVQAFLPTVK